MAFIKISADKCYNPAEHRYEDVFAALINIDKIESIQEFIPDDDEFKGRAGSLIIMNTGNEYVTMEYNVDQLMEMIEDKLEELTVVVDKVDKSVPEITVLPNPCTPDGQITICPLIKKDDEVSLYEFDSKE